MQHHKWLESEQHLQAILRCLEKQCSDRTHLQPYPVAVIFDLDSTIFNTKHRTTAIFRAFAHNEQSIQNYPCLCKDITESFSNPQTDNQANTQEIYDPIEFLNHHLRTPVQSKKTIKVLQKYWQKRFFHSDWLVHDNLYRGAKDFIYAVTRKHAHVIYLTARCEIDLKQGTLKSLQDHRLPHPQWHDDNTPKATLYLKPPEFTNDLNYKSHFLKKIQANYRHCIYIENEPCIINMALRDHPQIDSYLYASVHSNKQSRVETDRIIYAWEKPSLLE